MAVAMIRIEVGSSAAGFDLRESLARRGIQGVLVEAAAGWEVEIASPREEPERLFHDVAAGVESWLAGRGGDGLVAWVGLERRAIAPALGGIRSARNRAELDSVRSPKPASRGFGTPSGGPISAEEAPQAPVTV